MSGRIEFILDYIDRTLGKIENMFCSVVLALMVIVVGVGVFLRYVFNNPLVAGMNMATLMLVWITFAGASLLYREKGDIAIEFLMNHIPNRLRSIIKISIQIIIGISLIITVKQTIILMNLQWNQKIVALGIPRSFLSLPVVIFGMLMILTTFRQIYSEIGKYRNEEGKG